MSAPQRAPLTLGLGLGGAAAMAASWAAWSHFSPQTKEGDKLDDGDKKDDDE